MCSTFLKLYNGTKLRKTPIYLSAKHLNPPLSPLNTNENIVTKSSDFAEEVVNYDINLSMSSLDVESLFTNILWKKLLRTVSNTYFPTISIVVN